MTSELTQIVNLVKSKNEKMRIFIIKRYTKLKQIKKTVILSLLLILKLF